MTKGVLSHSSTCVKLIFSENSYTFSIVFNLLNIDNDEYAIALTVRNWRSNTCTRISMILIKYM